MKRFHYIDVNFLTLHKSWTNLQQHKGEGEVRLQYNEYFESYVKLVDLEKDIML